jgi:hypothetical protein
MARGIAGEIKDWFGSRLPAEWFSEIEVDADPDEILVVGTLSDAEAPAAGAPATGKGKAAASKKAGSEAGPAERSARIARFREETREKRMEIASEAERLFNRKVSWGAASGDVRTYFTHLSIPVMTRLRLPERAVLDTLVASGVARSRSHALAWCARLVSEHQSEWIDKLRKANAEVEKVRREGPTNVSMV